MNAPSIRTEGKTKGYVRELWLSTGKELTIIIILYGTMDYYKERLGIM